MVGSPADLADRNRQPLFFVPSLFFAPFLLMRLVMDTITYRRTTVGGKNKKSTRGRGRVIALLLAVFLLFLAVPVVFAGISAPEVRRTTTGEVVVTWKAVKGATGYQLLYGPASGVYGQALDVGEVLSYSLADLRDGQSWYFAVQFKNAAGAVGGRSPETELKAAHEIACAPVSLAWDPSESPGVSGYLLYYGPKSGTYHTPIDVGRQTKYTVPGLSSCLCWYFAVVAYDQQGHRSGYSNEVMKAAAEEPPAATGTGGDRRNPASEQSAPGDGVQGSATVTETSVFFSAGPAVSTSIAAVESEIPGSLVAGTTAWPADGGWLTLMPGREGRVPELGPGSVWQLDWPDYNAVCGESRVATGDLDGDGLDEIVIGFGPVPADSSIPNGYFQVLDDDGTLITWGQVGWPAYNADGGETWPATADLDGDGIDEIIIGLGPGGYGGLEVFELKNDTVVHRSWKVVGWPEYADGNGSVRPAGADLDGDGIDEIVAGLGPVPGSPELPGGFFAMLWGDGSRTWGQMGWQDYDVAEGELFPAAGDLDADGTDEIVLGLGDGGDGFVEIQSMRPEEDDKPIHSAWLEIPWQEELPSYHGATHPAVGNLDSDSAAEIAVALGDGGGGWIHLYNQETHTLGEQLWAGLQESGFQDQAGGSWVAIQEQQ